MKYESTSLDHGLSRMLFYALQGELKEHVGKKSEHIGITDNMETPILEQIGCGHRLVGVHESCLSGDYKKKETPIPITCIIFGDYEMEYHLAYIGPGSDSLEDVVTRINSVLSLNNLPNYTWNPNTNGIGASTKTA